MLSPVTPAITVDHSFTAATPRQEIAPAAAVTVATPADVPDAPNLASGSGIRAVSGELQLSKNVSVLAETLGKLLNIARMDGEAAEAYVNRLVNSIKTLAPDQRAGLEKALGDILRGISLDSLVSALKNSSGPEAARLAVLFELTRSGPAAPQAKPSVPTYLQDLLLDSLDEAPTRTPLPAPANSGKPLEKAVNALITARADSMTSQVANRSVASQAVPNGEADSSSLVDKPVAPGEGPDTNGKSVTSAVVTPREQSPATPLSQTPQGEGKSALTASAQQPQTTSPQAATISANQIASKEAAAAQVIAKPINSAQALTGTEEEAAPARVAAAEAAPIDNIRAAALLIADAFATATPKQMERLLLSVLLGKLPQQADVLATPLPAASVSTPYEEPTSKSQTPNGVAAQAKTEQAATGSVPLPSQRPEILAAQRASVANDIKAILLEQPTLQAAVAAMIGKEATALPYVAYPMAKDETESDSPPRGRWPSSQGEGEEAEGGGEHQQEDNREERTAANDEPFDHSVSEGANDDANMGDAESYYLRMSGFS